MIKKLLGNIPLKLMSVLIGIVVWLVVVNVDDPIIRRTITNVPVTITNESYVESAGLMCLVEEDQNMISVEVSGKRSVVDSLTPESIVGTADLTQITDMNTIPVMVPVTLSCPGIAQGNLKANPLNIRITLDDMMTQEFLISTSAGETVPGRGYEVGSLTVSPERVQITGPQSLIQKIDQVIANVDVSDLSADTTLEASLTIFDKNQDQLSELQMNYLKYDISNPKANVQVDLWKIKNDIALNAGYMGIPEVGYKVGNISLTPNVLSIAGTDEVLEQLTAQGNTIQIPAEYIDVSGLNKDFEVKIGLGDLLPEGARLISGSTDTAIATVSILPQDSKEYSISTTNIQAQNVGENLRVVYETDRIQVRIREGTRSLGQLRESDIRAIIDFSGKAAGSYNLPVTICVPEGYEIVDEVKTAVTIVSDTEIAESRVEE